MATPVFFDAFFEHEAEKVHNLGSDTLKVMLLNSAPDAAADAVKADLPAEIAAGFGYSAGGATATVTTSAQTAGVYTLAASQVVITASGGDIGPWQYAVLYNDTPTSPADPLIMYADNGSSVSIVDGQSLTIRFNSANPGTIFTKAAA
jgi:hypothetical protein